MQLSIVIVSYNTADLTVQTLESIASELASNKKLAQETEIIIVDNNSTDASVSAIKTFQKKSKLTSTLIPLKKNIGFGPANNQAVATSSGKYILFLNSDIILKPKALQYLLESFETHPDEASYVLASAGNKIDRLGIVAAQLLNKDGSIQAQGGSLPNLFTVATHFLLLDDLPVIGKLLPSTQHTGLRATNLTSTKLVPREWVGGTAMMVRKDMLDAIGGFDEHIFMYGEDIELCLRAKSHHWDVALQPKSEIIHLQNQSSSSKNALLGEIKGYQYIWAKHKPLWQKSILNAILQIGIRLRILLFGTIFRNPTKVTIYTEALELVS